MPFPLSSKFLIWYVMYMNGIPEIHLDQAGYSIRKELIVKNVVLRAGVHPNASFPHRHNFYVICLVSNGSGIHVIDFEDIPITQNRLFIISPYQVHFWKLKTDMNVAMIQFSESILQFYGQPINELLSTTLYGKNYIDINTAQNKEVQELALKLGKESLEIDSFSTNIIRGYLLALCGIIDRLASNFYKIGKPNHKIEKLHKFIQLINKYFTEQKSVSFYANKIGITSNYLNMLSVQFYGKNASKIIKSRIMLEAKRLLYHTSSDIGQVAFELGFEDPSYFAKVFKRFEKKTPTEFREQIYKKYQR